MNYMFSLSRHLPKSATDSIGPSNLIEFLPIQEFPELVKGAMLGSVLGNLASAYLRVYWPISLVSHPWAKTGRSSFGYACV